MNSPISDQSSSVPRSSLATSSPGPCRIEAIDGFRAFAAIWVLSLHVLYVVVSPKIPDSLWKPLYQFVAIGYLGVNLFLVLSGFCLFYPLVTGGEARLASLSSWRGITRFLTRRAWRILPSYFASIILIMIALTVYPMSGFISKPTGAGDMAAHAVMVHNLFFAYVTSISVIYWSLALESQLYIAFPGLVWLLRKLGVWIVPAVTLMISLMWSQLAIDSSRLSDPNYGFVMANALPARLWDFACGMAAAWAVGQGIRYWQISVFLAILGIGMGLYITVPPVGDISTALPFGSSQHWIWSPTFAILLVLACQSPQYLWRPIAAIGEWSYSLYLVHPLTIVIAGGVGRRLNWPLLLTVAGSIGLSFAASYAFYRLVERPFLMFAKSRRMSATTGLSAQ